MSSLEDQKLNKVGPIVRIAPNQYSIDDVAAAKIIYGHGTAFLKVSLLLASSAIHF